jgi:hypothetical protein
MARPRAVVAALVLFATALAAGLQPPLGPGLESHVAAPDGSLPPLPDEAAGLAAAAPHLDVPGEGLPDAPAPALGVPVSSAPGMPAPTRGLPLDDVASAGSPYDALLSRAGSASGLALAGGAPRGNSEDDGPPGSPRAITAAALRLSASSDLGDLQRVLVEAGGASGFKASRALYAKAHGPEGLERAVAELHAALGLTMDADQRASVHEMASRLDPRVRDSTALIVFAIADAQRDLAGALARMDPPDLHLLASCLAPRSDLALPPCEDADHAADVATRVLDRAAVAEAGMRLLSAVEQALPGLKGAARDGLLRSATPLKPFGNDNVVCTYGDCDDSFADPYRLVQVGSMGDDVYEGNLLGGLFDPSVQMLTLDLAGNDRYANSAGGAALDPTMLRAQPQDGDLEASQVSSPVSASYGPLVSVTIDLQGDDSYTAVYGAQGSGRLGLGILIELGGNDRYSATSESQGFGSSGVGLLVDAVGDDSYSCQFDCQAHGRVGGLGVLFDATGNDGYSATDWTQGVGVNQGAGFLADAGGNDRYVGGSLAQGATERIGVGVLVDTGGIDSYATGSPGRGAVSGSMPYNVGVALFIDRGSAPDSYAGSVGSNANAWTQGSYGHGEDS